jgi:short-subunit dehydrogenase
MTRTNPGVAVVTGASSGIGRATAEALQKAGYRVFGTSRRAAAEGSSTKHAIEGYSESLDHELRTFGIRVVLVEPAYTKTSFEENVVRPDRQLDIYDSARAGMNVILRKAMTTGDAPEIVAETILNAATAAAPKRRYAAGKMARQVSLLRRFVPESAFDKSLRKQNDLPV